MQNTASCRAPTPLPPSSIVSAEHFSVADDAGKSEIVFKNQDTERGIGVAAVTFVFHFCSLCAK
jgi:hypothetical protein